MLTDHENHVIEKVKKALGSNKHVTTEALTVANLERIANALEALVAIHSDAPETASPEEKTQKVKKSKEG